MKKEITTNKYSRLLKIRSILTFNILEKFFIFPVFGEIRRRHFIFRQKNVQKINAVLYSSVEEEEMWREAMRIILSIIFTVFLVMSSGAVSAKEKYYGGHLCGYEGFSCVKIKRGDTWAKLFPDKKIREVVKRLNRMNVPLYYRRWIVVPDSTADFGHMDLSPFPDYMETSGERLVVVDLSLHAFGAYDESGQLIHWGPVSGGKGWCPDVRKPCNTATGSFRIIRKQGAGCVSSKFPVETAGGAPMPYCMHYYRGFALHGSTLPGFHASHGCLRLFYDDAEWLNKHFVNVGTRVIVTRGESVVEETESEGIY